MPAGPRNSATVERLVQRRHLMRGAFEIDLDPVHQPITLETVPFESVHRAVRAKRFDHEANGVGLRPLRRTANVTRQQEVFVDADRRIVMGAVIDDLEQHVAAHLMEKPIDRSIVKVGALARTPNDGDPELRVAPDPRLRRGRLQEVLVPLNPVAKIERQ